MKTALMTLGGISLLGLGLVPQNPTPSRTAQAIKASEAGIGRVIQLRGQALGGQPIQAPLKEAKATVIALTSTTCPLCQKYGPTLAQIEKETQGKGVKFIYLSPGTLDSAADLRAKAKKVGWLGQIVQDPKHQWTKELGSQTTTEVYVLDAKGALRYRGAVDDQYSIGASLAKPRNNYLRNALTAVLSGKTPKVEATSSPGCILEMGDSGEDAELVTFHEKIEPIIHRSCLPCHRPEGVAPFPLDSYEAVKRRAAMIDFVVSDKIMPPWFAEPGSGPWRDNPSLSDAEKAALSAWIKSGTPRGNPAKAPKKPTFASSWTIGQPDQVFALPTPISVPATGVMPYENVVVPTGFTEDKWVEKIEVLPGDRRAVHHVLVFLQFPGGPRPRQQNRLGLNIEEIGGFFGAYVPGNSALTYPAGFAKRIPKGASLRFQIHYTPYGTATKDQTKIGLVFAKTPPKQEVHTTSIASLRLSIPPGADNHAVTGKIFVPFEVQILSYLPHMHVRGKAARYELVQDGATTTLLNVPRYDFNWQLNYVLQQPLTISKGSELRYTAWYDNSANNPANPDPTRRVTWGEQTIDEMHLGYLEYIVPGETPGLDQPPSEPRRRGGWIFGRRNP